MTAWSEPSSSKSSNREVVVVDGRVGGHDRDAVVSGRFELDGRKAGPGQLGHERVVVRDFGAGAAKELDQLDRRRLPRVADVGLVGDAEDEDLRAVQRRL